MFHGVALGVVFVSQSINNIIENSWMDFVELLQFIGKVENDERNNYVEYEGYSDHNLGSGFWKKKCRFHW